MAEFNIITAQVEATSRKEWLKNRRTEKANLSFGSASSVSDIQMQQQQPSTPGASNLAALTDVSLSGLAENDLLIFDGEAWKNVGKEPFLKPISDQLDTINGDGKTEGSTEWKILQTLKWKTLNQQ